MATFTKNGERVDPYKNFKFRVYFGRDTKPVAGVSKIGSLKRTTEVVSHREGGDPSTSHKSPGRTEYDAIMLERGVTHDRGFDDWANLIWKVRTQPGGEVSLKDFRRDIRIVLLNENGDEALAYNVYRCWVSEYQALPELDANANAIAIQSIKLENEGWEIDAELPEPDERGSA
ncbi:MAG: phage tail protein [Pirellulales bacterium]|nr:phage tail protein [Pirellulales bacterium]